MFGLLAALVAVFVMFNTGHLFGTLGMKLIQVNAFTGQIQKLILSNNIQRAIKLCDAEDQNSLSLAFRKIIRIAETPGEVGDFDEALAKEIKTFDLESKEVPRYDHWDFGNFMALLILGFGVYQTQSIGVGVVVVLVGVMTYFRPSIRQKYRGYLEQSASAVASVGATLKQTRYGI